MPAIEWSSIDALWPGLTTSWRTRHDVAAVTRMADFLADPAGVAWTASG